jgi:hypothetical protein
MTVFWGTEGGQCYQALVSFDLWSIGDFAIFLKDKQVSVG